MTNDSHEKLKTILEMFDNAMLATISPDGRLRARPMQIAELTDSCNIWFATDDSTGKVDDIENNAHVNVTMQGESRFVSLSGIARVVNDRGKLAELWDETWKVWFPAGKDDPNLRLLHVRATDGEYWDRAGTNTLKYMLNAGKAYFAGEQVEVESDMNAKVKLG